MNNPIIADSLEQALNRCLENLNWTDLWAEADRITGQRQTFLEAFGPQALAALDESELLRRLPFNLADDRPLDYWLEFRRDSVFDCRLFGGIAGGSAAKFGVWQDRRSGHWRAPAPGSRSIQTLGERQALEIVAERRREMLAAVAALAPFVQSPLPALDPESVQSAVATAAPRWHRSSWLHKYLHLVVPERVTWHATLAYLQAALYRLGAVAGGTGWYALDIHLGQVLAGLPVLAALPVWLRYRAVPELAPRAHGCLNLAGDIAVRRKLLSGERLALGPAQLGNLAGLFSLSRKAEIRQGLANALQTAGLDDDPRQVRDLITLGCELPPGSLVALCSDALTVTAVGEISGPYQYRFREERSQQLPVRWLHQQPFLLSEPVDFGRGCLPLLPPDSTAVAELEASLLRNGLCPSWNIAYAVREPTPVYGAPAPPAGRIAQLLAMLERKPQILLYGPPGAGKTYYAERAALELVARHNFHCVPAQLSPSQLNLIGGRNGGDPYIVLCTFHPLYGYEDFIEGYRPEREGFSLKPGLFRRLVTAAQARPDKSFVLIIDEINRGNIPKIFGELITLLEPARRGRSHVVLPLSGDAFSVPANLYMIATMNTADRSILLLDTALRRRFGFIELLPEPELLQASFIGDLALSTWLQVLNRRLRAQLGREGRNLQIGHAYFMPGGKPVTTLAEIAAVIREDIWPLLQEYCYEDPHALATILAADQGGIYDRQRDDLRYELFEPGREEELVTALRAIVGSDDSGREE